GSPLGESTACSTTPARSCPTSTATPRRPSATIAEPPSQADAGCGRSRRLLRPRGRRRRGRRCGSTRDLDHACTVAARRPARDPDHAPGTGLRDRRHALDGRRRVRMVFVGVVPRTGRGTLDLATAFARSGSYRGVWPMGLLVTMKPSRSDPAGAYIWTTSHRLRFELTVEQHGRQVAARTFGRGFAGGLTGRRLSFAEDGLVGVFYAPLHAHGHPGVVIFGGSEGGYHTLIGALLAAHGYPTLSLAYFARPGLPENLEHIPLEYFAKALRWFAARPQVDAARIAVGGVSYGSAAALLLAIHYPELVHAVIASVPTNVGLCGLAGTPPVCSGYAWTFGGRPVPYTTQFGNPAPTDNPNAIIPVERIRVPIFLDCAGRDEKWPSCPYAQAIVARLKAHGSRAPRVLYEYPDAEHFVGAFDPYEPGFGTTEYSYEATERAREALWPRLLAFLGRLR